MQKKSNANAINAPAVAQPIPIPAAAPLETPDFELDAVLVDTALDDVEVPDESDPEVNTVAAAVGVKTPEEEVPVIAELVNVFEVVDVAAAVVDLSPITVAPLMTGVIKEPLISTGILLKVDVAQVWITTSVRPSLVKGDTIRVNDASHEEKVSVAGTLLNQSVSTIVALPPTVGGNQVAKNSVELLDSVRVTVPASASSLWLITSPSAMLLELVEFAEQTSTEKTLEKTGRSVEEQ